jgi:hypothetical protein
MLTVTFEASLEVSDARPHPTAWFAPFPPAVTESEFAVKVSPGPGHRDVDTAKSIFSEPTTQMWVVLEDMLRDLIVMSRILRNQYMRQVDEYLQLGYLCLVFT